MVIHVNQISESEPLQVNHHYPNGEPDLGDDDSRIVGRPALQVRATREGDEVKLDGRLHADVEVLCDRCATPFRVTVEQPFELLYVPPLRGAHEEKELGEDDLAIAFYQDQMIDLDDLVREQVEMALPMGRLCRDDCRGLCPQCGKNLNEGACDCRLEQDDPRWAALKDLKINH